MKNQSANPESSDISANQETEIGKNVSDSVVVTGDGNVINVGTKKTPTRASPKTRKSKQKIEKRRQNITIIVAVIGLIGTICAAIIASPVLDSILNLVPNFLSQPVATTLPSQTPPHVMNTTTPLADEFVDEKDVPMVLIPAGEFVMGWDGEYSFAEQPTHRVYLDAYYIDKFEVTNSLYQVCVWDGVCEKPEFEKSSSRTSYYGNPSFDDFPVIYVNWYMAKTYCDWRGATLPTEAQWEKSARGGAQNDSYQKYYEYPWSWYSRYDCTYANYAGCLFDTALVDSREKGKSFFGVYNLAGNVAEWVADWYDGSYYEKLGEYSINPQGPSNGTYKGIRGGSWHSTDYDLKSYIRRGELPKFSSDTVGFRCVVMP